MGMAHGYSCAGCGYDVESMISGVGNGGRSSFHGILCLDCKELLWADLGPDDGSRPYHEDGDKLPAHALRCPEDEKHRVEPWTDPGPCPKCGARMVFTGEMMLWD